MNQDSPSPLPLQLQALLNRLQARLGGGLADAAASLLAAAEQAPARVHQEWQLFWQEVELESERLARGEAAADASAEAPAAELQQQIDRLRARVAAIAHKLDA
jgi:uncharacterized protein YceH (UPF0502 family)